MSGYHPDAINEVLQSRSRNSRAQDTARRELWFDIDDTVSGGVGHFPTVSFLRCPVAGVIVVEGESLGARRRSILLDRVVRIEIGEESVFSLGTDVLTDQFLFFLRQGVPDFSAVVLHERVLRHLVMYFPKFFKIHNNKKEKLIF